MRIYKMQGRKSFKLWANGNASRRKLKTCVHLRLRLARTCVQFCWLALTSVHLRWLALTLVEIKFALTLTHFFHRLANLASQRIFCSLFQILNCTSHHFIWHFANLHALATKLACPFGHPTQVCMQVELATSCVHSRYRLASALRHVFWQTQIFT